MKYEEKMRVSPRVEEYLALEAKHLIRDMRYPPMWYVEPTKAQISLRICPV